METAIARSVYEHKFVDDPQRPQYHFSPWANWMNDPNGLIQWQGQYHLFYQHNPHGPFWGTIHWGHAVSDDLVHWTHWPIALEPTPGGPDAEGCWSGSAVDNNGVPTLVYTGGHPQVVCVATAGDSLRTWHKYPGNPVIAGPPAGLDTGTPWDFRDPYVWKEDGHWYMVIGARIVGSGGAVLLYRSPDLYTWEYVQPLLTGDPGPSEPFWTGTMWECPNFLRLGERHVLLISVQDKTIERPMYAVYFAGTYGDHTFSPESQGILDYGGYYYAPLVLRETEGRHLVWGWLPEGRTLEAQRRAGWAGVLSLPRVLSWRHDGRLGVEPAPELRALRQDHRRLEDVTLQLGAHHVVSDVSGDCLELIAEFEPGDAAELGLVVRRSPDRAEETLIVFDCANNTLSVDRQRSSLSADAARELHPAYAAVHAAPYQLAPGERLRLHIFLDRSVVEVFANGQVTYTSRIYPTRADSLGVALFAGGGRARLVSLDAWTLKSIWAEGI